MVDDLHRYLTVEEIFGDSSNYTCERTWVCKWISLIWRPIKWWQNYENSTKAHWWNWPGTINYQGQCGRVLCGPNNSGGAWYHQGSSPPGKRVHSFISDNKYRIDQLSPENKKEWPHDTLVWEQAPCRRGWGSCEEHPDSQWIQINSPPPASAACGRSPIVCRTQRKILQTASRRPPASLLHKTKAEKNIHLYLFTI